MKCAVKGNLWQKRILVPKTKWHPWQLSISTLMLTTIALQQYAISIPKRVKLDKLMLHVQRLRLKFASNVQSDLKSHLLQVRLHLAKLPSLTIFVKVRMQGIWMHILSKLIPMKKRWKWLQQNCIPDELGRKLWLKISLKTSNKPYYFLKTNKNPPK